MMKKETLRNKKERYFPIFQLDCLSYIVFRSTVIRHINHDKVGGSGTFKALSQQMSQGRARSYRSLNKKRKKEKEE